MMHWSYTAEQKEEVKKALAAGVPKATILTYFYPEVTVEKMDRETIKYAAETYGTPAYIFDFDILKNRIEYLNETLGADGA